jgi:hypothetical protein
LNSVFINCSNHSSTGWESAQLRAAEQLGRQLVDIPFPAVPPEATRANIETMAVELAEMIKSHHPAAVLIMGEMTLTFATIAELQKSGIVCVASTTARVLETLSDGTTRKTFVFCMFREYPPLLKVVEKNPVSLVLYP